MSVCDTVVFRDHVTFLYGYRCLTCRWEDNGFLNRDYASDAALEHEEGPDDDELRSIAAYQPDRAE